MAGHNKWTQIKRQKAVTDAKRSKIFSKLARLISVEAKLAQGKDSSSLRSAIEKAKKANMPKDIIERALKKGSEPGARMESIVYEAYGPCGVGIIIETLTDNKNRTAQEVKHILSVHNTSLSGIGAVTWAFDRVVTPEGLTWKPNTFVELEENDVKLLDLLVDELEENDDVQEVYTNAE